MFYSYVDKQKMNARDKKRDKYLCNVLDKDNAAIHKLLFY